MTNLKQAARLALEVMESGPDVDPIFAGETITALRTALEQPEQEQERWQWIFEDKCGDRYTHKNLFYTEAEAAESAKICGVKAIRKTGESKVTAATPVAQPEQEPVAIVDAEGVIIVCSYKYKPGDKLYTTPPAAQRPWQGLTDDEILEAAQIDGADTWLFATAYAIEAKLKEKNNG